jgi:hypothetical protein
VSGQRHAKLGIKQTIQKHWMDKTVQMLLAGLDEKEIRTELDEYLSTQKQSGGIGLRGKKTYGMAIGLLASWFAPEADLVSLRNDALAVARKLPESGWLPLHWLIISAAYPFWFNTARQVGRLFNLQEKVTQAQIFNRLKEHYGDRETVSRNARYAVRSFIAWGIMKDGETRGWYEKSAPIRISDPDLAFLMLESALSTIPAAKENLDLLLNNPGFFPFQLPLLSGGFIAEHNNRIDVVRFGLDEVTLALKPKQI